MNNSQKNNRQRAPTASRPNQLRDRKTKPKASPTSTCIDGDRGMLIDSLLVFSMPCVRARHSTTFRQSVVARRNLHIAGRTSCVLPHRDRQNGETRQVDRKTTRCAENTVSISEYIQQTQLMQQTNGEI